MIATFTKGAETILTPIYGLNWDFPSGSDGKESACSGGDLGSIPGSGRSPGEGNGKPLQYSCLENPMDRGAWWATVHGVAKSWTRLSNFTSLTRKLKLPMWITSYFYLDNNDILHTRIHIIFQNCKIHNVCLVPLCFHVC